jgi:uncharacterized protein YejL (UPF0352 family)
MKEHALVASTVSVLGVHKVEMKVSLMVELWGNWDFELVENSVEQLEPMKVVVKV